MNTKQLMKFSIVAAASLMLYTTAFSAGMAKAVSDTATAGEQQSSSSSAASKAPQSQASCETQGGTWKSNKCSIDKTEMERMNCLSDMLNSWVNGKCVANIERPANLSKL